jgi:hypothetical protein
MNYIVYNETEDFVVEFAESLDYAKALAEALNHQYKLEYSVYMKCVTFFPVEA